MADTKREIERKYEATDDTRLPDLTRAAGVDRSVHRGLTELDAVYHDTADLRLAADALTLRRRTGGADEGWHLKFPVATGIRDELHEPLADTLPRPLAALLRSRVRHAELAPVVRLRSARDVHHLTAADGTLLAEVSVDRVRAERLAGEGSGTTAAWTEIEVELADDGDPAVLDAVEKRLRKAGIRPAGSSSKLARALAETTPVRDGKKQGKTAPHTAGDHVLAYVRKQIRTIVDLDPAVRRDLPDSVHRMRVATRRLRSAFKTHRKLLDRAATDPLGAELKWLAAELGLDRDQEVLDERLGARVEALPATLALGPVRGRLRAWSAARRTGSRRRIIDVLDGKRYLGLLDALEALSADPPLRPAARRAPGKALPRAVLKDYERLARRMEHALEHPPGPERDIAMHEARKAAKRARYAGESARPALGKPAKRFAKRVKAVQTVLGDHQDSVVAREALRTLAIQSHAAGETAFTWGLLYAREEAAAEARERELPEVWARASDPVLRADLKR
ncbi:CYTH and CHAD domain-containing protein [Streptomyces sp. NRRL_ISP-5395]|uniref:CYTH and CHAD domain-containing protein n=1 Tax=Streptomyces TaxID=1883 RepID=UPI001873A52A|nr:MULTISPECIES: CYTH and CHAD domain-containing protein [Streptomyces]MDX2672505.1 CYTH and CHAD domain-containing protein [Streptomyces sp. NRRL_ISP-5395]GHF86630.1 CHAD domain-containing protein [Streptomyces griseus]